MRIETCKIQINAESLDWAAFAVAVAGADFRVDGRRVDGRRVDGRQVDEERRAPAGERHDDGLVEPRLCGHASQYAGRTGS